MSGSHVMTPLTASMVMPVGAVLSVKASVSFGSASVALNRLAPDPQYPGIVDDYRRTFERMKSVAVDAYLAPHPEQFGLQEKRSRMDEGSANPFVDPSEKDRRMTEFEQAFEAALAQQQQPGG